MLSPMVRHLSLASAAIEHALYFMEIGAETRAQSYIQFAFDQLEQFTLCANEVS